MLTAIGALMAATTSSGRSPTLASARLSTMIRASLGLPEHVERVDRDAQVLHGRDVEGRDEHQGVGLRSHAASTCSVNDGGVSTMT